MRWYFRPAELSDEFEGSEWQVLLCMLSCDPLHYFPSPVLMMAHVLSLCVSPARSVATTASHDQRVCAGAPVCLSACARVCVCACVCILLLASFVRSACASPHRLLLPVFCRNVYDEIPLHACTERCALAAGAPIFIYFFIFF